MLVTKQVDQFDETQDAIHSLQEAIRCNTVNPPGNERGLAEKLKKRLEEDGVEVRIYPASDGRANLVARISGASPGPRIVLSGHLDTVPIGEAAWKYPPFEAISDGGHVYGRGSADMKGGLIALMFAFLRMKRMAPADWCGELWFAATFGEETGAEGAKVMVEKGQLPAFDAMIIAEPTHNRLVVAHKGVLWVRVDSVGRTAHASMPKTGVNAIAHLHEYYSRLKALDLPAASAPLLSAPTVTVTTFNGGKKTNVIPDICRMTIDIRTLPDQSHEEIICDLRDLALRMAADDPSVEIKVEPLLDLPGISTSADAPIVQTARAVLAEKNPDGAQPNGVNYFTDGSAFYRLGGDIIVLGPGLPEQAHQTDENVSVEEFLSVMEIYFEIIKKHLGTKG